MATYAVAEGGLLGWGFREMIGKKFFTIEEVSKELGISKQTIIRYEKKGIFPSPKRDPINKWRRYTNKDIERLKDIREGKREL